MSIVPSPASNPAHKCRQVCRRTLPQPRVASHRLQARCERRHLPAEDPQVGQQLLAPWVICAVSHLHDRYHHERLLFHGESDGWTVGRSEPLDLGGATDTRHIHRTALRRLGGMFETWNTSFLNVSSMALLAVYTQDSRAIGMLMSIIGYKLIVLIDANNRLVLNTILICCVMSLIDTMCATYVLMGMIDEANTGFLLFAYGLHLLQTDDIITNGAATSVLIYLRNAYRKHVAFD